VNTLTVTFTQVSKVIIAKLW